MTEIIAVAISSISATIAIFSYLKSRESLRLSNRSYVDDHEYSRRKYACDIIAGWDSNTMAARNRILAFWRESYYNCEVIPFEKIKQMREEQQDSNPSGTLFVTDDMSTVLNYLEYVAASIRSGVASERVLYEVFRISLNRWFRILEEYRTEIRKRRDDKDPWLPLTELYHKWYDEKLVPLELTGIAEGEQAGAASGLPAASRKRHDI